MQDSQKRCAEIIERCIGYSQSDEQRVSVVQQDSTHLRFARNSVSTSALVENLSISVRSSYGQQSASVSSNRSDSRSLKELVRQAEAAAKLMPADPEALPELGPNSFRTAPQPELESVDERLAALVSGAHWSVRQAHAASLIAAGFIQVESGTRALGTSAGLLASYAFSGAHFSTTVRTPDGSGSGWSSCAASTAAALDFKQCSRVAIEKAVRSVRPSFLAPASMPAILEPDCVASLLQRLLGGMGARERDEGRSAFSAASADTQLFPSLLHVQSNPYDSEVPVQPWNQEGLLHPTHDWIKAGRLGDFACDRYWAKKSGQKALPSAPNALMLGGHKSLQELIEGTERAILVTNLWYLRQVDAQSMLTTGLTRDGVFLVENGELVRSLNNFRWNDSPIRIFGGLQELSRSLRVGGRGGSSRNYVVPAMKVKDFRFTSISEAV